MTGKVVFPSLEAGPACSALDYRTYPGLALATRVEFEVPAGHAFNPERGLCLCQCD